MHACAVLLIPAVLSLPGRQGGVSEAAAPTSLRGEAGVGSVSLLIYLAV